MSRWKKFDWLFLVLLLTGTALFWTGVICYPARVISDISWHVWLATLLVLLSTIYFTICHPDWNW